MLKIHRLITSVAAAGVMLVAPVSAAVAEPVVYSDTVGCYVSDANPYVGDTVTFTCPQPGTAYIEHTVYVTVTNSHSAADGLIGLAEVSGVQTDEGMIGWNDLAWNVTFGAPGDHELVMSFWDGGTQSYRDLGSVRLTVRERGNQGSAGQNQGNRGPGEQGVPGNLEQNQGASTGATEGAVSADAIGSSSAELASTNTRVGGARLTVTGASVALFGLGAALATAGGMSVVKANKARKAADV